jgi:hypothetical protein
MAAVCTTAGVLWLHYLTQELQGSCLYNSWSPLATLFDSRAAGQLSVQQLESSGCTI